MKKLIFGILFILSLSLVSCNSSGEDVQFDFNNLTVNLDNAVSLGISESNRNGDAYSKSSNSLFDNTQTVSAEEQISTYVLTRVDESGDLVEVVYHDEEDNEIIIPMNLLALDIIDDYIFLVYVSDTYKTDFCSIDFYRCGIIDNGDKSMYGSRDIFKWLNDSIEFFEGESYDLMRFITINSKSGKVFDLGDIALQILDGDGDGIQDYESRLNTYVYDNHIYINSVTPSGPKAVLNFNEKTNEMDVNTFLPSAEGVQYVFTTPKGTTFIKMNESYHYFLSDDTTFGDWEDYFPNFINEINDSMLLINPEFSEIGEIEIMEISGFISNSAINQIIYIVSTDVGDFLLAVSANDAIDYIFQLEGTHLNARVLELSANLVLYDNVLIDLELHSSQIVNFNTEATFYGSENHMTVILNSSIYQIDYSTKEISLIDENITYEYDENDENRLYYTSYTVNVGLTKVHKKIIYDTGEIITGDFIPTVINIFSVKPMN